MHNESLDFYLVYSENNFLYNLKMTSEASKWLFLSLVLSVKFQRSRPNKFKIVNVKLPVKQCHLDRAKLFVSLFFITKTQYHTKVSN